MGGSGRDVEVDGRDPEFEATFGFASGRVASVRLEADGEVRIVTPSPCGAFCALAVGTGTTKLTPLNHRGRALGEGISTPGSRSASIGDALLAGEETIREVIEFPKA